MKIFIFRHAEKSLTPWENPPLNPAGQRQSQALVQFVLSEQQIHKPCLLICSPKIRAHQSFQPLAAKLSLQIETASELDERLHFESHHDFSQRVARYLAVLESKKSTDKGPECVYICTHLDWIEEAMLKIPCDSDRIGQTHWHPLTYMAFKVNDDGLWKLLSSRTVCD